MDDDPTTQSANDDDGRILVASLLLKLRSIGISDRKVLNAIEAIPRNLFVPEELMHLAYEDRALPIECGQTISAPSVVAMMTAALDLGDRHKVLEIGTGSGYQTAILSRLARRVTSLERFRTLIPLAEARWAVLGISNISVVQADGNQGWSRQAPFDRIIITAACETAPSKLVAQLVDEGILIAPIGSSDTVQRLTLFQKYGTRVDTRDLGGVRFVPMMSGVAQNL